MRPGLVTGINVDPVDVAAGMQQAREFSYDSPSDQMVVEYALMRWKRGEEAGAERTWLSYFPHDYTSWRVILAAALTRLETS